MKPKFFSLLKKIFILSFIMLFTSCNAQEKNLSPSSVKGINLPDGFQINVFAENVEGARSMALSENGILFVGTRKDRVYAIKYSDEDYKADKVNTIVSGLNMPNGVAVKDGDLYVAEVNRVIKFKNLEENYKNNPNYEIVYDKFPDKTHHGWKFIRFGPDGKLYVPVGAPCNVCLNDEKIFGTITRMNPDGSDFEIYASGIRNTVGFDWNPETNILWFTDNGRDMLGDNIPPDELNRAPKKGMNFGFPFMFGKDIRDPQFGEGKDLSKYTKPVQELGPHVASLGMRFYTGDMFPDEYKNQIFIAEHGSWNRSKKIGYRVSIVKLDKNQNPVSYEPFAEGWLHGESVSGRPVDVQVMPDGSMLVSDDYNGIIYRITYN